MTDAELAAIEAREQAATPGPWRCWDAFGPNAHGEIGVERIGPELSHSRAFFSGRHPGEHPIMGTAADFEFVADSRDDIPALVAEVRRLRALCGDGGRIGLEEVSRSATAEREVEALREAVGELNVGLLEAKRDRDEMKGRLAAACDRIQEWREINGGSLGRAERAESALDRIEGLLINDVLGNKVAECIEIAATELGRRREDK